MSSKHKQYKKKDVTINQLPMDTAIVEVTCNSSDSQPREQNYSLLGISSNCHKVHAIFHVLLQLM